MLNKTTVDKAFLLAFLSLFHYPSGMVRSSLIVSLFLLVAQLGQAQLLAPADKKSAANALLNLLKNNKLKENATIDAARKALDQAVQSDRKALDLHLDSIKKVNWDDKKKSTMEWQKWRATQKQFEDKGFARAVRYSMMWAQLSLSAQQMGEYRNNSQAEQVLKLLTEILADKIVFLNNKETICIDQLKDTFGKAYGVTQLSPENWPASILDVQGIFEQLIFKRLRTERNFTALRKAWDMRIMFEVEMAKKDQSSEDERDRKERGVAGLKKAPVISNDVKDGIADLEWQREVDCFKAGDEAQAMRKLFSIVKSTIDPKIQSNRIKECLALMKIDPKGAEIPALDDNSNIATTKPSATAPPASDNAVSLFDEDSSSLTTEEEIMPSEPNSTTTGTTVQLGNNTEPAVIPPPPTAKPAKPKPASKPVAPKGGGVFDD